MNDSESKRTKFEFWKKRINKYKEKRNNKYRNQAATQNGYVIMSTPATVTPRNPHMNPPNSGVNGANGQNGPSANQQGDSYFTESRKGEVNELRALLRTFSMERNPQKKREIIKKVIAYMTLGIDVSRLFSEMMLAIETRDLVIKKMVYLFLCNYATSHPELAQMCTNTLQKDCSNDDPMVRGLALRALCSLRLPQMVEYICDPLKRSLTDPHAYVRKTGVMGVLKMWHLDVQAFEQENFVDTLYDMLRDQDSSVVINCIIVLDEIMAKGENGGIAINRPIMLHLLNRIHEFSEFGIVKVLELVPRYRPYNDDEAYQIMNLLDPVLKTSNSAAVMATIRGFLSLSNQINGGQDKEGMMRQVATRVKAPIITLVTGGSPELMYCILTHILSLVNICPGIFDDEYRQFYVRYNEPTHVQYLKIQILSKLTTSYNSNDIISELGHYVAGINTKLSRLAIRGMAAIACRAPSPFEVNGDDKSEEAITLRLVEMLDLDIGHVPSEAAIALTDVLRKHPNLKQIVAHRLPRALRFIDEPEGKAAIIWLLGEVADHVPETPYAIEKCIDSYQDIKDSKIKMALLTTTMKLFFKRPPELHKMLGKLLQDATEDVSNQDLHDRALLYYRLLRSSPKIAETVIGAATSTIPLERGFAEEEDFETRAELMEEFNTLSILYGKVSENFIAEEYQVKYTLMPDDHISSTPATTSTPTVADESNNIASLQAKLDETALLEEVATKEALAASLAQSDSNIPAVTNIPPPVPAPVADLLDFMDSPSAPVHVPESAPSSTVTYEQGFSMTSDEYQGIWGDTSDFKEVTFPINKQAVTTDIEKILVNENIYTMASGELPNELKFFLYCKDNTHSVYLLQAVMSKAPLPLQMALIIKTKGSNANADILAEKIKALLA